MTPRLGGTFIRRDDFPIPKVFRLTRFYCIVHQHKHTAVDCRYSIFTGRKRRYNLQRATACNCFSMIIVSSLGSANMSECNDRHSVAVKICHCRYDENQNRYRKVSHFERRCLERSATSQLPAVHY